MLRPQDSWWYAVDCLTFMLYNALLNVVDHTLLISCVYATTLLMLRYWNPNVYVNTRLNIRGWLFSVFANTLLVVPSWLSYVCVLRRCWCDAVGNPMFMFHALDATSDKRCIARTPLDAIPAKKKTDSCVASKAWSPTNFRFHWAVHKGMRRGPCQSVI